MSFVAQFTDKLRSLAEVLIHSFPEKFDSTLFEQIEQQREDPTTNIGQMAVAVAMSDFVAEAWQKQPAFLAKCWEKLPHFEDCDQYAERLDEVLQHVQTEEQLYRELRLFRAREMVKLSVCQSLNFATVEQVFIRLSQLAESLIIGVRDWLYARACEEMGTPMDAQGNAQQLYILGMGKLGGFELNFSFDKEESSLAEEEPVIFEEEEEPSEEIIIDFGAEATEGQEEKAVETDSQEEK